MNLKRKFSYCARICSYFAAISRPCLEVSAVFFGRLPQETSCTFDNEYVKKTGMQQDRSGMKKRPARYCFHRDKLLQGFTKMGAMKINACPVTMV